MVKVVGRAECERVDVEVDPWISLNVSWHVKFRQDVLYLMIAGIEGGYVELKVNSADGALVELIVVEEPPPVDGYDSLPILGDGSRCLTPTFDLDLWSWNRNPDYSEPKNRVSRLVGELGMSTRGVVVTLVFSESEPVEFVGGGQVRIGIAAGGDLSCLVAAQR